VRPATERYVRAVYLAEGPNIELILGVAYFNPNEYWILLSTSKMLLRDVVDSLSGSHAVTNPALLAGAVEAEVVKQWPHRLFFLEVCSAGDRDGWVQVYAGQVAKLEERIETLSKQRCVGCLAEAQYRAKEDDRLEQRIVALEEMHP
jgi:hypothetical protein